MPMLSLLALMTLIPPEPPRELYEYLAKPDTSFDCKVATKAGNEATIAMTSQTWHGTIWKHQIIVRQPTKPIVKDTAILYITGDGPFKGDMSLLEGATMLSGLPVAMLFDIPNQPLWEHREDDLIAHTFEQYLATGDPTWPLLFPMTKAAIRAMDAVQRVYPNIRHFVVTGASKRGWTTWMVGAAKDKRVLGIAPMVYDNLNLPAQMAHQKESWGSYSPMIEDYTKRGLQGELGSERGAKLATMVDPYAYRRNITEPTLVVKGSNDPYWTTDALDQYWNGLAEPKWIYTVPNAGHDLNGGMSAAQSISAFARALCGTGEMPKKLEWQVHVDRNDATAHLTSQGPPLQKITLYTATSPDRHFDGSHWAVTATMTVDDATSTEPKIRFSLPAGNYVAAYSELTYKTGARVFSLSTPTVILRR